MKKKTNRSIRQCAAWIAVFLLLFGALLFASCRESEINDGETTDIATAETVFEKTTDAFSEETIAESTAIETTDTSSEKEDTTEVTDTGTSATEPATTVPDATETTDEEETTAASVSVTFRGNGFDDYTVEVKVGDTVEPYEVTVGDYAVEYWYLTDSNTPYDFTTPVTESMVLTAKLARYYGVTFVSGGVSCTLPKNMRVKRNENVILPAPTDIEEGKTFLGWSDGVTLYEAGATYARVTSAVTFTAQWSGNYTYRYELGEGAAEESLPSGTARDGEIVKIPAVIPTAENKVFKGWFDGSKYYFPGEDFTMPAHDVTLTADFADGYSVTYNGNFYSYNPALFDRNVTVYRDVAEQYSLISRVDIGEMQGMDYADHTFLGWYTDAACTNPWDFDTDKVSGNITLYAKWRHDYFNFEPSEDGTGLLIYRYDKYTNLRPYVARFDGVLELPDSYEDIPIVGIRSSTDSNDGAFYRHVDSSGKLQSYTTYKAVRIPASYKYIGDYSFYGNSQLETVILEDPDSITYIGVRAFYGVYFLQDVDFGANLERIGERAFYDCGDFTKIDLSRCLKLVSIGPSAFQRCFRAKTLTLPVGGALKEIGKAAFAVCSSLEEIIVPEGVTTIGNFAFAGSSVPDNEYSEYGFTLSRAQVKDHHAKYVGYGGGYFIYRDENNEPVDVSGYTEEQIAAIVAEFVPKGEKWDYYNWGQANRTMYSQLKRVVLPSTLEELSMGMFAYDDRLEELVIQSSFRRVPGYFLAYCDAMESFTICDECEAIDIGAFAFMNGLTSITFGKTGKLTTIGDGAFNRNRKLTRLVIPEGVTTIGSNVFSYMDSITYLELPSTLNSLGIFSIGNNPELLEIRFAPHCQMEKLPEFVATHNPKLEKMNIPWGVKTFWYGKDTEYHTPQALGDAFSGCPNLMLYVEEGHPYFKEYPNCKGAFYTDWSGRVVLEYVSTVTGKAEYEATGSFTFRVAPGTEIVNNFAFSYNQYITELIFPASVRGIGNACCQYMHVLETVIFEHTSGLTETGEAWLDIGYYAFAHNATYTGEKDVRANENATNVKTHSLKTVVMDIEALPNFVHNRDDFNQFFESAFDPDFTIYVPDKSLEKYKAEIGGYAKYFRPLSERPTT